MQNKYGGTTTQAKKDIFKPAVDEKKEQMKNALFSGISTTQKKDSDSDDDKPVKKDDIPKQPAVQPVNELNLLDMDDS